MLIWVECIISPGLFIIAVVQFWNSCDFIEYFQKFEYLCDLEIEKGIVEDVRVLSIKSNQMRLHKDVGLITQGY